MFQLPTEKANSSICAFSFYVTIGFGSKIYILCIYKAVPLEPLEFKTINWVIGSSDIGDAPLDKLRFCFNACLEK